MVIVRVAGAGREGRLHISLHDTNFVNLPWDSKDMPLRSPRSALVRFAQDQPSSDVVSAMGQNLLGALRRHPTVKAAVESALTSSDPCPIYLRMDSVAGAEYPWETLFDGDRGRFLALSPQWPIARMMPGPRTPKRCYATPPLRIVAVLSAVGVPARGEWQSLRDAVESSGLALRMRVVVGERGLFDEIQADLPDWAECTLLSSGPLVRRVLNAFNPHLVHFFCHGTARPQPLLELATPQGHAAGLSDLQLTATDLRKAAPLAWLTTLNCCSGASDVAGVRGLASELVLHGGIPAAIGMREPITDRDAHLFCEHLYSEILTRLADAFAEGAPFDADWMPALCHGRLALRGAHANGLGPERAAARHRQWSVPILCVEAAPLTIDPVAPHPSHPAASVTRAVKEMNTLEHSLGGLRTSDAGGALIRNRIDELRTTLAAPA